MTARKQTENKIMTTKVKSTNKRAAVKIRDLKAKKDAKGGRGSRHVVSALTGNHNETFLRD